MMMPIRIMKAFNFSKIANFHVISGNFPKRTIIDYIVYAR